MWRKNLELYEFVLTQSIDKFGNTKMQVQ